MISYCQTIEGLNVLRHYIGLTFIIHAYFSFFVRNRETLSSKLKGFRRKNYNYKTFGFKRGNQLISSIVIFGYL